MTEAASSQDIPNLSSAVHQLTLATEGLGHRRAKEEDKETDLVVSWYKHWFVVRESAIVPFVRLRYLKSRPKVEVESDLHFQICA